MNAELSAPSREKLLHSLYEAAELEHNLMCTYLYAAFSLKAGADEGLTTEESAAVERWRRTILDVAIDEMGHLTAVWNITAALGGTPRFGRGNFPLDPGGLPAGVVVKLAPFNAAVLQHFIYLERPAESNEPDGEGFARQCVQQDDSLWSCDLELARALAGLKRPTEAEAAAAKASELNPANAKAFLVLGNIHIQERKYQAVVQDFDAYLKLDPTGPASDSVRASQAQARRALEKQLTAVPQPPLESH